MPFDESKHPRDGDGRFTDGKSDFDRAAEKYFPHLISIARCDIIALQSKKGIKLSKKEYAMVMSEISTNITKEQRKMPYFAKCIGNHCYFIRNNGFGYYIILSRRKLK